MSLGKRTRKAISYGLAVVLLGMIQVALPELGFPVRTSIDFLLIIPLYAGYSSGSRDGMFVGLLAGFFRDLFCGRLLGIGMLAMMYLGLFAGLVTSNSETRNQIAFLLQIVAGTAFNQFLMVSLIHLFPLVKDVRPSIGQLLRFHLPGSSGSLLRI